jgi:hypothetical protein
LVQGAEEKGPQEIAMQPPAVGQTTLDLLSQEPVPSIKPPFGLYEVEKQHAGELEQNQPVPVVCGHMPWQSGHHAIEGCPELSKEPPPDRLS